MPAIPRKTAKIFGSDLTPAGNLAQFGSLAAGAPAFSGDPDVIQALAAWGNALNGAVVGSNSPAKEDLNAALFVAFYQLAYLLQTGIPAWDAGTTYFEGNYAQVAGNLYVSLTPDNTGNNPVTDTNNWQPAFNVARGSGLAAAWVEFDGINVDGSGNSLIHSSKNVDHVVKNLNGSYTVVFASPLPGVHYGFFGSCGSEDGGAYGAGDDGVVVGNVTGQGNAIHSAAQCRVFTINPTNKALVQSGNVSVVFFAP